MTTLTPEDLLHWLDTLADGWAEIGKPDAELALAAAALIRELLESA